LSSASGIEAVVGSDYSDTITGNARNNDLEGRGGDDSLSGGGGSDLYRFAGDGLGSDTITESANSDRDSLVFIDFSSAIAIDLTSTSLQTVSSGNLQLTLSTNTSIEVVQGTAFGDTINGNNRDNFLEGGAGNDTISGGDGRDVVFGGALLGADGSDSLSGGAGDDIVLSGSRYDAETPFAIDEVMDEWSGGNTYVARVANILGSGLNPVTPAQRFVPRATLFDSESSIDTLQGGSGDDWFLSDFGEDIIADALSGEIETDIGP
jgi:Ca2+-binding RTX toxin-like protein